MCCLLHRENLPSQKFISKFSEILKDVVDIVNFITICVLSARLFYELCEKMISEFKNLLLHSISRWLSKQKIIQTVLEIQAEVEAFRRENNFSLLLNFQNGQ